MIKTRTIIAGVVTVLVRSSRVLRSTGIKWKATATARRPADVPYTVRRRTRRLPRGSTIIMLTHVIYKVCPSNYKTNRYRIGKSDKIEKYGRVIYQCVYSWISITSKCKLTIRLTEARHLRNDCQSTGTDQSSQAGLIPLSSHMLPPTDPASWTNSMGPSENRLLALSYYLLGDAKTYCGRRLAESILGFARSVVRVLQPHYSKFNPRSCTIADLAGLLTSMTGFGQMITYISWCQIIVNPKPQSRAHIWDVALWKMLMRRKNLRVAKDLFAGYARRKIWSSPCFSRLLQPLASQALTSN